MKYSDLLSAIGGGVMQAALAVATMVTLAAWAITGPAHARSDVMNEGGEYAASSRHIDGKIERVQTIRDWVTEDYSVILRVRTNNGQRVFVDLGSRQNLDDLEFDDGERISARGYLIRVSDRSLVLLAEWAIVDGEAVTIRRADRGE